MMFYKKKFWKKKSVYMSNEKVCNGLVFLLMQKGQFKWLCWEILSNWKTFLSWNLDNSENFMFDGIAFR